MDPMIECIPEKEVTALVNAIGKTMDGHSGGMCALALCHCLAAVMEQTGVPLEFVTELLKKYIEIGASDETAH